MYCMSPLAQNTCTICFNSDAWIQFLYPFQTGLMPCSPQTRVWGEQWMTFLGNPYVNTRYGQYAPFHTGF